MNILNTHIHELIFNIDKDAPSEYMKRWIDLKTKCENGENKHIIEQLQLVVDKLSGAFLGSYFHDTE